MSKPLSLLFAVIGTLLMLTIAVALGLGNPWLVLLAIVATLGFIGFGFVVKARLRRKAERPSREAGKE